MPPCHDIGSKGRPCGGRRGNPASRHGWGILHPAERSLLMRLWKLGSLIACIGLAALPMALRAEPLPSGTGGDVAVPADQAAEYITAYFGEHVQCQSHQEQQQQPPHESERPPPQAQKLDDPSGLPEPPAVIMGLLALGTVVGTRALWRRGKELV